MGIIVNNQCCHVFQFLNTENKLFPDWLPIFWSMVERRAPVSAIYCLDQTLKLIKYMQLSVRQDFLPQILYVRPLIWLLDDLLAQMIHGV